MFLSKQYICKSLRDIVQKTINLINELDWEKSEIDRIYYNEENKNLIVGIIKNKFNTNEGYLCITFPNS